MKLQNKTILVTGAGRGIGKEIVVALISKGAKVIAIDLNKDSLRKLSQQFANQPDSLTTHTLDIVNLKKVEHFAKKTTKNYKIDAIINCAGIIQPFVKIQDLDYKAMNKVMDVNFYGTVHVTKAFLPLLLKRPEAKIVNFSSMGGFLPVPGQGVYGASKAAVKLFTEALYAELISTNVKVSLVFPGATNTNIAANSNANLPNVDDSYKTPMLSPQQVAYKVIRGIEKDKLYIYTGKDSKFMNKLYRLNPAYATRFIAKKMQNLLGA